MSGPVVLGDIIIIMHTPTIPGLLMDVYDDGSRQDGPPREDKRSEATSPTKSTDDTLTY